MQFLNFNYSLSVYSEQSKVWEYLLTALVSFSSVAVNARGRLCQLGRVMITLFMDWLPSSLSLMVWAGEDIFLSCLHQWGRCPPAVKDHLTEFFRVQLRVHHPKYITRNLYWNINKCLISGAPILTKKGHGQPMMFCGVVIWRNFMTSSSVTWRQWQADWGGQGEYHVITSVLVMWLHVIQKAGL